ncbi:hypothetical protein [Actinomyces culturomici]|uniref:hypothetical protein n=1 Tax=Actinomyces culturomici TaxID=1926276 RepID=UPI00135AF8A3|nr:hypothetical protein [Actinomyces culturomici]
MIKRSFTSVLAAGAIAAALLSGCSSNAASSASSASTADSAASAASTAQSAAPLTITKKPENIDGAQVTLPVKRVLIFDVDSADVDKWSATIADGSIAEFVAGSDSAQPMIRPLAEGETTVELTAPDGATTTFSLIVTPGIR